MKVELNGQETEVGSGVTVAGLLESLRFKTEGLAVEVNRRILRRSEWASTPLAEGDRVEIVHFVGGG